MTPDFMTATKPKQVSMNAPTARRRFLRELLPVCGRFTMFSSEVISPESIAAASVYESSSLQSASSITIVTLPSSLSCTFDVIGRMPVLPTYFRITEKESADIKMEKSSAE